MSPQANPHMAEITQIIVGTFIGVTYLIYVPIAIICAFIL